MKHCVWIFLALTISSYGQTPGNGVTDIDGNTYNSVIIGTQEWQKENLNVSKYTDGTIIPQVTDATQIPNLTTGAWCYYNLNPANGPIYGKLYNWYAVAGIHDAASLINPTLRKQLAPTGWHIASDIEWTTLTTFLGGISIAGGKMKEIGTTYWISPNTGATNTSNFRGLGAGAGPPFTDSIGQDNLGKATYFWSSTESSSGTSWIRILLYSNSNLVVTDWNKKSGFSVRCLKNSALNNQSFYDNSFNIYPNPTKDYINIDISNLTDTNGWRYKIVNTLGQEVLKGVLSYQQNIVQLNNIKGHGIYFVKIYDSSNNLLDTKKIIIQQ
jgi:uncharacterized protein (TIGR02145 family)